MVLEYVAEMFGFYTHIRAIGRDQFSLPCECKLMCTPYNKVEQMGGLRNISTCLECTVHQMSGFKPFETNMYALLGFIASR